MDFSKQLPRAPNPSVEFNSLAKRVSSTVRKKRSSTASSNSPKFSPRMEIYKSMLREIKNEATMYSLVHKACGILRLTHYNEINNARRTSVSWDYDGRRVVTYEDYHGGETTRLQRDTLQQSPKKGLLDQLNDPVFALESQKIKVLSEYDSSQDKSNTDDEMYGLGLSKVWEHYIDTGDSKTVLRSGESILSKEPSREDVRHRPSSPFYNDREVGWGAQKQKSVRFGTRGQSMPIPSTKESRMDAVRESKSATSTIARSTRSHASLASQLKNVEKQDRIQHICVVNGTCVPFRNFGFENFSNWFGDQEALDVNQRRALPKFHFEVDFTGVISRDIKIRFVDNFRLEFLGYLQTEGRKRPLRLKESVVIPENLKVEDLLICRNRTGKIVIEDVTKQAPQLSPKPTQSRKRLRDSKPSVKIKPN